MKILSLDVPLPPGLSPSTATALVQQQHRLLAPRGTKALKIKGVQVGGVKVDKTVLLVLNVLWVGKECVMAVV